MDILPQVSNIDIVFSAPINAKTKESFLKGLETKSQNRLILKEILEKKQIIGICGFIGSGKDTAADYLIKKFKFKRETFASSLKDVVASIFGWDRIMLEGLTKESREKRETIDIWWSERLNIPNLTPRSMLQQWGTEVCRKTFHNDIWIASLEKRLQQTNSNIVVSDVRFPNEIAAIKNMGGKIIWIRRGTLPIWYHTALETLRNFNNLMEYQYPEVHSSEWHWINTNFDYIIENDGTIEQLHKHIRKTIFNL